NALWFSLSSLSSLKGNVNEIPLSRSPIETSVLLLFCNLPFGEFLLFLLLTVSERIEMSFANHTISFSNEFEITRGLLTVVIGKSNRVEHRVSMSPSGVVAVSSNILCMFFTIRQSSALSSEYVRVLLILKEREKPQIFQLAYDIQTCFLFIVTPLFPCKGHFMRGLGAYMGMNAHISLVDSIDLTKKIQDIILSAWFNCCLFHRHQVILPFDHPAKVFIIYSIIVNGIVQLQPRGIYGVYFIMNFVMIINPISLIFTTTNDSTTQRPIVANASSSDSQTDIDGYSFSLQWLESSHCDFPQVTFALCTLTTTILTQHAAKIMNARCSSSLVFLEKTIIVDVNKSVQQRKDSSTVCNSKFDSFAIRSTSGIQMNVTTFGMGFPTIFWSASIIIGFTMSRVTAMLMLFLPLSSCCNSVYAIVSTKVAVQKWKSSRSRNVLQSSVDFILGAFLRKRKQSVKPRASMTAFTVAHNNGSAFAVPSNLLFMYFTVRQSSALSSEYVKVLLILKTCIFFIIAPVFPCKAVFVKGIGVYLRLNGHIPFVINLTTLSMICAWFNCCLFHRHQVILPFDHTVKLQPRGIYGVYFLMNFVMMINPISFMFTTKNDEEAQRSVVANSPMAWLLDVPSHKIYTDDNCPLIMVFHFPLLLTTFGVCTITTTVLTTHAAKIMNARRSQISETTILMQQRLINSLQFQSSVDFILGVLRIRKVGPTINPRTSMTAFTVGPGNSTRAFAVPSNILLMYLTVRQSSSLSSEYVKVILILKLLRVFHFISHLQILQLVYDLQTCIFFIIAPVFPCKVVFLKGIGSYLRLNGHIPFAMNFTTLSLISAWFNCCLFHRYQVILPFDHKAKLGRHGMYSVYILMNFVLLINPIAFMFSTKNDENLQRFDISNSPMTWVLEVPFKIYTNENCPLFMIFQLPMLLTTFGLCTFTTTFLTTHARMIMNARRNRISATTILMQQRLNNNLHFHMNVQTFGMGVPTTYWETNLLVGFILPSKLNDHSESVTLRNKKQYHV
uniref:G protein-coupled receptor n=1 Tax=Pristionchus pacificus TaxID=54126 RepID=A0A8R1YRS9_PRIPA